LATPSPSKGLERDCPGQVAQQAVGDPRVEDHGDLAGRRLARAQALDRALAGLASDLGRVVQVAAVDGTREVVVALHAETFPGDHGDAERMTGAGVAAGKAVRGRQGDPAERPAGLGALRIGDAGDGPRRLLAGGGPLDQGLRGRLGLVADVELRRRLGQLSRIRQPAMGILRHHARHGHGPLDQIVQHAGRPVARGDDGLAPADQHPEAQVVVLLALEPLELPEALGIGQRDRMHE
jgi:hypothetical protein